MDNYADLMFHRAVAELQRDDGSYEKYQAGYNHRTQEQLSPDDIGFIQSRESMYLGTGNPDGWPYVQHRGGPRGFLKVIGPSQIACADYRGNRQFISMGNIATNTKVSLFLMDYLNQARLKIEGRESLVSVSDADPDVLPKLDLKTIPAERILVVDVVAMDWNCPKYIPRMFTEDMVRQVVGGQIDQLMAENEALKAELAALKAE